MIVKITKELHPVPQRPDAQKMKCNFCTYPVYVDDKFSMLEIRNDNELWKSEDNGDSWNIVMRIPIEEKCVDGSFSKCLLGPLINDPVRNTLICFEVQISYRCPVAEVSDYFKHCEFHIPNSTRNFYRISHNKGISWSDRREMVIPSCEYGKSSLVPEGTAACMILKDASLMLSCQCRNHPDAATYGSIQANRLNGVWNEAEKDYNWSLGGRIPGGGCEQAIERLNDDRFLSIMRTQGFVEPYYFNVLFRPFSISSDEGKNWSIPRPLCWDDGIEVVSPRAWSQLVRASNGKLYWIANILPDLAKLPESTLERLNQTGRADPRYPLQIVEVDEENITLKRSTLTTIIDREPGETEMVRFSNFYCYNDRKNSDIVIYIMKAYHENQTDIANMPHTAWKFRITPEVYNAKI